MALTFHDTHCCAVQEINGLKGFHNKPKEAMFDFCKKNIATKVKFKGFAANQGTTFSFYLFTAAVYEVGTEDYETRSDGKPYKAGSKYADNYGAQFARFIRENKLGTLMPSPIKKNSAYHKDHFNQCWLWMPNREALINWYTKECEEYRVAEAMKKAKYNAVLEKLRARGVDHKVQGGRWYPKKTLSGYDTYVCKTCGDGIPIHKKEDGEPHVFYLTSYVEAKHAYLCAEHGLEVCGSETLPEDWGMA